MVCAAGASRSSRVGEPPSSAEPAARVLTRRSTWTANPSGSRGWVISASRRRPAPTAGCAAHTVSTIAGEDPRAGRRAWRSSGSPSTPDPLTAATPPRRIRGIRSASGSVLPGTPASTTDGSAAKYAAAERFRCGRRGRRRRSVEQLHPDRVTALGPQQADGGPQRLDVSAVPVDEYQPARPVAGRAAVLDQHGGQRRGADRDGARQALMLAGGAVGDRRGQQVIRDRRATRRRHSASRCGCRCPAAGAARAARSSRPAPDQRAGRRRDSLPGRCSLPQFSRGRITPRW